MVTEFSQDEEGDLLERLRRCDEVFTIRDVERWDRALYDVSLLKAGSLEKMWTPPHPLEGQSATEGYGFGLGVYQ